MAASPPAPLPRGRHKLDRDTVLASQRERILTAMTRCVATRGYAATTVTDVVSAARVSRNAFYELFADKHACFLVCCDELLGELVDELYAAAAAEPDWRAGLAAGMEHYLRSWQSNPLFAAAYLLELPSAGPEAIAQREGAYERFRRMFDGLAATARVGTDRPPVSPVAVRLLVAGITEVIADEVRAGRLATLHTLKAEMVRLTCLVLAVD